MEPVRPDVLTTAFKIVFNTWGDKKFKLRNKFGQLSDDDLAFVDGREGELIGRLRTKLNMSEAEVQLLISRL